MFVRPRAFVARIGLGLGLALASPITIPTPEAHATTIAEMSVEQLTDAATWIVRGTVTRTWSEVDDNGRVWTRAELDVSDVMKGPARTKTLVIDSLGGYADGQLLETDLAARYAKGEEIVVFLDTVLGGQRLVPVAKFWGKFSVVPDPDTARPIVVRFTVDARQRYDHRFIPVPAGEHVTVDDLTTRIRTHLKVGWDGQPIPGIDQAKLREINAPARRMP